jgi:hypothetical protein
VHLRDAHLVGDLALRLLLEEPQVQHAALARWEGSDRRTHAGPPLDAIEGVVVVAHSVGDGRVLAADGSVQ